MRNARAISPAEPLDVFRFDRAMVLSNELICCEPSTADSFVCQPPVRRAVIGFLLKWSSALDGAIHDIPVRNYLPFCDRLRGIRRCLPERLLAYPPKKAGSFIAARIGRFQNLNIRYCCQICRTTTGDVRPAIRIVARGIVEQERLRWPARLF